MKVVTVPAKDLDGGFSIEVHARAQKMGLRGKVSCEVYQQVKRLMKLEADIRYNKGLVSALQEKVDADEESLRLVRQNLAACGADWR